MSDHSRELPVLAWLQRFIAGKLSPGETTHMRYPTAISRTLAMRIVEIDAGRATVEIDADAGIMAISRARCMPA